MKLYQLRRTQRFTQPIEEVWEFFSSPENLSRITPSYMSFKIKSELPEEMYPGMIIEYRVKPLANIAITWVTEITRLQRPHFFIDEQRLGPYAFWHHQHHFKSVKNGTEVIDLVHYSLPYGIFGRLLHWLFIKRQLHGIFDYRAEVLKKLLPPSVVLHQSEIL